MAVFFSLTSGVFLDIFDISNQGIAMPARTTANQIAFRYRSVDSSTGITRETAKRLAGYLGVDETQAIHQALRETGYQAASAIRSRQWPIDSHPTPPDQEDRSPGYQALSAFKLV